MDCYRAFQRSGEYKIEANRTIKPEPCFNCGVDVVRGKSTKRNGEKSNKVFCSRSCYDEMRTKEINARKIKCKQCGDVFTPSKSSSVYCSMKCRNKSVTVNCTKKCKYCGIEFSAISYRDGGGYVKDKTRKTCSFDCRINLIKTDKKRKEKISKAFKGENHPMWRGGISSIKQSRGSMWRSIRNECLCIHDWKCVECGISNKESLEKFKTGLHIDHIKPWHEFDCEIEANKQSNLRPLCISCHGKHGKKVGHGMYKKKKENEILKILSMSGLTIEQALYIRDNYKTNGVSWSNISEINNKTGISKYLIKEIGNGRHKICQYLNDDKKLFDYIESLQKK
ncbi:MAG: HNH endonuclease [Marinomonas sp.]